MPLALWELRGAQVAVFNKDMRATAFENCELGLGIRMKIYLDRNKKNKICVRLIYDETRVIIKYEAQCRTDLGSLLASSAGMHTLSFQTTKEPPQSSAS